MILQYHLINSNHISTTTVSMATKLGRVVTYLEGLFSIKSYKAFITWPRDKTKSIVSLLTEQLWPPNLAGWLVTLTAPTHKVTWPFDHVVLQDHMTNWNYYIFTTTVPMAAKPGRMVTYLKELLAIKSFNALITWSRKVTWQTKFILSPLPECL